MESCKRRKWQVPVSLWRPIWPSLIFRLGEAASSSSCGRAARKGKGARETFDDFELQRPRDEDGYAVSYRRGRDMTPSQQRKSVTG